jgi:transposase-like protein
VSSVCCGAVDEHGAELDVMVEKRRDKALAKRFLKRVMCSNPVPRRIVTDQLRGYPAVKADIPKLEGSVANRVGESIRVVGAKRTDDPR